MDSTAKCRPACRQALPLRPAVSKVSVDASSATGTAWSNPGLSAGHAGGDAHLSSFSSSLRQKGKTPVSSTYSSTPADQMTEILPWYRLSISTSGAMYSGVPHNVLHRLSLCGAEIKHSQVTPVSHSVQYRLSLCGHQEPLVTLLHRQLSAAACASQSDALPKAATADAVDSGTAQPSCPQPHPSDAQKLHLELELTSPGLYLIVEGRNQAHKGQHTEESCAPARPWSSRSRTASAARRASRGRLPAARSPAAGAEGDHGDASSSCQGLGCAASFWTTANQFRRRIEWGGGMRGMEMTRAGAKGNRGRPIKPEAGNEGTLMSAVGDSHKIGAVRV